MRINQVYGLIDDLIEAYDYVTMRTIFETLNPAIYNEYLAEIKGYLKNKVDKGALFQYNYQYWRYKLKPLMCRHCKKEFWVKPSVKGVHFCCIQCQRDYYRRLEQEEKLLLGATNE